MEAPDKIPAGVILFCVAALTITMQVTGNLGYPLWARALAAGLAFATARGISELILRRKR